MARKAGVTLKRCGEYLLDMRRQELVRVLNPDASRSRVYWVTQWGKAVQDALCRENGESSMERFYPDVDWRVYGWVCFSHRSAVLKSLDEPLQPSEIKRRAFYRDRGLRMSANNVRDVIRVFLEKGVVKRVHVRGKGHPRYELTDLGEVLRELLFRAEPSSGGEG